MIGTQLFCLLGLLIWQLAASVRGNPIPSEGGLSVLTNQKRFYNYTQGKIRGVNLGGWLLLEPFITPSLFEAFRTNPNNDDGIPVDEYEFCERLGKELARDRLMAHWDTFYKEQDFIDIAAKGLNLVRIPVGYWAFALRENDPFVTGEQEFFLDRAIEWARKAGLKVWVDLHGAAGSQNGFDNSGLRDHLEFLDEKNMAVTKKALFHIMEKYSRDKYSDTVVGIQVLNEPLGPAVDMEKVKALYNDAYNYMRHEIKRDAMVVLHDAFQPAGYWDNFMTVDQGFWGVVLDHHHYHVFSAGELDTTIDQKIATACNWGSSAAREYHWTIHGEWSAALTDCTKWLNGVGRGARYDGTFHRENESSYYIGSCEGSQDIANWSEEKKVNTRRWIEAQLDAYELKEGWIFWTWKTEATGEWDLQRLIYHRLFPQPLNERLYPNPCGAKN